MMDIRLQAHVSLTACPGKSWKFKGSNPPKAICQECLNWGMMNHHYPLIRPYFLAEVALAGVAHLDFHEKSYRTPKRVNNLPNIIFKGQAIKLQVGTRWVPARYKCITSGSRVIISYNPQLQIYKAIYRGWFTPFTTGSGAHLVCI